MNETLSATQRQIVEDMQEGQPLQEFHSRDQYATIGKGISGYEVSISSVRGLGTLGLIEVSDEPCYGIRNYRLTEKGLAA